MTELQIITNNWTAFSVDPALLPRCSWLVNANSICYANSNEALREYANMQLLQLFEPNART